MTSTVIVTAHPALPNTGVEVFYTPSAAQAESGMKPISYVLAPEASISLALYDDSAIIVRETSSMCAIVPMPPAPLPSPEPAAPTATLATSAQ